MAWRGARRRAAPVLGVRAVLSQGDRASGKGVRAAEQHRRDGDARHDAEAVGEQPRWDRDEERPIQEQSSDEHMVTLPSTTWGEFIKEKAFAQGAERPGDRRDGDAREQRLGGRIVHAKQVLD